MPAAVRTAEEFPLRGDGRSVGYAAFLRKADGYGWKMKQKTINGFLKAMKVNKVMKRWIWAMVAVFVVLFSIDVCAQENERGVRFGGGADVVSGYIWRGVWEAGPSIQPTLVLSAGNFSATAWGSVDFASTSYKEMDLTLAYALGPVTVSLADLYWEGVRQTETLSAVAISTSVPIRPIGWNLE